MEFELHLFIEVQQITNIITNIQMSHFDGMILLNPFYFVKKTSVEVNFSIVILIINKQKLYISNRLDRFFFSLSIDNTDEH
jgi:hypothetical protein